MRITTHALGDRIAAVMALDPAAPAIEFERRWRTWGALAATVESVAAALPIPGTRIGVLLRNRPAPVAFLLGALRAGACVVAIDPQRGVERTRREIASLALPCLAGEPQDLEQLVGPEVPSSTLAAADAGAAVVIGRRAPAADRAPRPGVAVQMLTSGTTGPPKRVDLAYEMLRRVLVGAKHYESNREEALRLRTGVAVVNSPLVHLGGLFRVLQCVSDGRSFALLERFTVDAWVDAVRRHRPATASLVPAALRMVLEADIDPADLGSIRSVISGTAPLSPDDADAFTAKYGVPVLGSYAATEFGGGVAGWNLADYQRFWSAKRGSVGRAHAGCALRVVDPDGGRVSTPTASSGSWGAPTASSFAAASRCTRTTCVRPSRGIPACAGRRWWAAPMPASAPCRSPSSSCATAASRSRRTISSPTPPRRWRATSCRPRSASSTRCRARRRRRSTSRRSARCWRISPRRHGDTERTDLESTLH